MEKNMLRVILRYEQDEQDEQDEQISLNRI